MTLAPQIRRHRDQMETNWTNYYWTKGFWTKLFLNFHRIECSGHITDSGKKSVLHLLFDRKVYFQDQIWRSQSEIANMLEFPRDSNKIHSISFALEKLDPKLCRGRYQMLLLYYSAYWQSPRPADIDPTFWRN